MITLIRVKSRNVEQLFSSVNFCFNSRKEEVFCTILSLDIKSGLATTTSHSIGVLEHYRVTGSVLDVCKIYLANRYQSVEIKNTIGNPLLINMGIPQGTILRPISFVIYINSLLSVFIGSQISSYADYTVLIFGEIHGKKQN